jgi:hypothetical protein
VNSESQNEKRNTKSEKRKTKNEKRKTKSEKRKAKNEKQLRGWLRLRFAQACNVFRQQVKFLQRWAGRERTYLSKFRASHAHLLAEGYHVTLLGNSGG